MTDKEIKEKVTGNEPTDAEIEEFWEWCGATVEEGSPTQRWIWCITFPDGITCYYQNLGDSIDLNNLFKHAVPQAVAKLADRDLSSTVEAYHKLFYMWLKLYLSDPVVDKEHVALFRAIQEVIHNDRQY